MLSFAFSDRQDAVCCTRERGLIRVEKLRGREGRCERCLEVTLLYPSYSVARLWASITSWLAGSASSGLSLTSGYLLAHIIHGLAEIGSDGLHVAL